MNKESLIFEKSRSGRVAYTFPDLDIQCNLENNIIPESFQKHITPILPEVSEIDVVRHYSNLSLKSFGVDFGFYPLGSCTMKYNPKINETVAQFENFSDIHPLQPVETIQGTLKMLYLLQKDLCSITGMADGTLQPFAGAHGEFTGMKIFRAYFQDRGELNRKKLLVPSSSHGTNPASAHLAGFEVIEVQADNRGLVSLSDLEHYLDDNLAGIMLTNPNTLGLFEKDIVEIAKRVHEHGGLLYYDGANMNAIMGQVRPGDMGFDVIHLNLHKTFSTPHGGGGPGAGPVLVSSRVAPFLPDPSISFDGKMYFLERKHSKSIGRVSGFYGNIGVLLRAFTYIKILGADGLKKASEYAVLNANYVKEKLKDYYNVSFSGTCMHEFVLSLESLKTTYGISAIDIAKGLLDHGIHPPTMYFPLIVPEALMIEPTETETKETLDNFIDIMIQLNLEAQKNPEKLHGYPYHAQVKRVDEVQAARNPVIRWDPEA